MALPTEARFEEPSAADAPRLDAPRGGGVVEGLFAAGEPVTPEFPRKEGEPEEYTPNEEERAALEDARAGFQIIARALENEAVWLGQVLERILPFAEYDETGGESTSGRAAFIEGLLGPAENVMQERLPLAISELETLAAVRPGEAWPDETEQKRRTTVVAGRILTSARRGAR